MLSRSGEVGNPETIAHESQRLTAKAAAVLLPLGVAGGALVDHSLALLCLAPIFVFLLPELKLRDRVAQRREGVEKELPFFSILVNVLGGAGVSLYAILEQVAGSQVFSAMRREALLVKRDVRVFGINPIDSLERLAVSHPSRKFSEFLLGYASKVRSGGDVPAYLAGESGAFLRELGEAWMRYTSRVGIVGSMMITVFGVIPLLLMVVGVFSPGFSILGLVAFCGLGVPMFTMALLYMAGRMQPVGEEELHGRAGRSLALSLVGAAAWVASGAAWVGVAAVLSIFLVAYGLSVREHLAETRRVDEGLSRFLGDLLEYKRQEYDLVKAVLTIESGTRYNLHFDRVLANVALQLKGGVQLDEVQLRCRSRLAKLVFLIVGQMSKSGGGTVDTAYQVSGYAGRLVEMKRNTRSEMKPYLVLSYVSPILLAFGVTFVGGVLSSFSGAVRPGFASLHLSGFQVGAVPPALMQVSDLLIVVSAAALGLIGAKITDLTVKNTLRASVNVAVAVAAVGAMTALGGHSLASLFAR